MLSPLLIVLETPQKSATLTAIPAVAITYVSGCSQLQVNQVTQLYAHSSRKNIAELHSL